MEHFYHIYPRHFVLYAEWKVVVSEFASYPLSIDMKKIHPRLFCEAMGYMPEINVQALLALGMFLGALFVARVVVRIQSGDWPGGALWVLYLRILLGFLFGGAIVLGFYSIAGIVVRHP